MIQAPTPSSSSAVSPWLAIVPAVVLMALVLVDTSAVDFAVEGWFYTVGDGFIGKHAWVLEDFMHDFLKKAVIAFALLALLGWMASFSRRQWQQWRRPLGYLVLAMGLSAGIVTPLKVLTGVQCPWDIKQFGGSYTYVHILDRKPEAEPRGRCWPAGHAATGFSLFALFFFLRDRHPQLARRVLVGVLTFGSLLALGRMIQGAHFLSHSVATGLIAWLICLGCYRLLLYRRGSGLVRTAAREA
jgi:LSD1 subclass zinc finger protein